MKKTNSETRPLLLKKIQAITGDTLPYILGAAKQHVQMGTAKSITKALKMMLAMLAGGQ